MGSTMKIIVGKNISEIVNISSNVSEDDKITRNVNVSFMHESDMRYVNIDYLRNQHHINPIDIPGLNVPIPTSCPTRSSEDQHNIYYRSKSQILKKEIKDGQKHKWKVGEHYLMKVKPTSSAPIIVFEYKIVQVVYKISEIPMRSLIVEQVSGPKCHRSTLNRRVCKKLHVRWKPGLEIIPMDLPLLLKK